MEPGRPAPSIRDYIDVVWSRRWSSLAIVLLVVASAIYFTYRQTPTYQSSAAVLVKPICLGGGANNSSCQYGPMFNLDTESRIASSPAVAELAAQKLGSHDPLGLLGGLSVAVEPQTEILQFSYTSSDRRAARSRAEGFAQAYIAYRRQQAQAQLDDSASTLQAQVESLNKRIQKVEDQLQSTSSSSRISALQPELNSLIGQQTALQSQIASLTASTNLDVGDVVQPAELPLSPISPSYTKNIGVGVVGGIILAIAIAFLRDRLDTRIRSRKQLELMMGAPVLAVVPHISAWHRRRIPMLVTVSQPESPAAEAYRTLRTALLFAASERKAQVILVTSSIAGEGKSATTANLGVTLAQYGHKVVLVGADLRRSRLATFFREGEPQQGLTEVLTAGASPDRLLMRTRHPNLRVIAAGGHATNPSEILGSERMSQLLAALRKKADFVLIDTPPVLANADALGLVSRSDAVLFVVDAQRTSSGMIADARERLFSVQAPVVGSVLNNVPRSRTVTYGYVSYASAPPAPPTPAPAQQAQAARAQVSDA